MRSTCIVLNGGKQRSHEGEGNAVAEWSATFIRIVDNPELIAKLLVNRLAVEVDLDAANTTSFGTTWALSPESGA